MGTPWILPVDQRVRQQLLLHYEFIYLLLLLPPLLRHLPVLVVVVLIHFLLLAHRLVLHELAKRLFLPLLFVFSFPFLLLLLYIVAIDFVVVVGGGGAVHHLALLLLFLCPLLPPLRYHLLFHFVVAVVLIVVAVDAHLLLLAHLSLDLSVGVSSTPLLLLFLIHLLPLITLISSLSSTCFSASLPSPPQPPLPPPPSSLPYYHNHDHHHNHLCHHHYYHFRPELETKANTGKRPESKHELTSTNTTPHRSCKRRTSISPLRVPLSAGFGGSSCFPSHSLRPLFVRMFPLVVEQEFLVSLLVLEFECSPLLCFRLERLRCSFAR